MENKKWSIDELKAYLFIYCSNADFIESKIEDDFIKNKVSSEIFNTMHSEYNSDDDYSKVLKIEKGVKDNSLSKVQINDLMEEIKSIFVVDHKIDILEENLFRGLKHILFQ